MGEPKPVRPHEILDESGLSDNPVAVTTVPRIVGIIPSRIFIIMTSIIVEFGCSLCSLTVLMLGNN
ncbi:hypothetical protein JCM21531_2740 [Acetivibrio straminisolvens JCM 21531]|uniref:Uncharacterized protein n=1 Tax=Acetivibrio straminisolvens JCM 21531 TaxID=1294263 RepID=W4V901_9FIRM|nr:hypothetical protein JCM21531_2740 [Acetivibrio straminisolvens JCM 21531]